MPRTVGLLRREDFRSAVKPTDYFVCQIGEGFVPWPSQVQPSLVKLSLVKPSLVKPSLVKPSLVKPSLVKSSLVKPSLVKPSLVKPLLVKPRPDLKAPGQGAGAGAAATEKPQQGLKKKGLMERHTKGRREGGDRPARPGCRDPGTGRGAQGRTGAMVHPCAPANPGPVGADTRRERGRHHHRGSREWGSTGYRGTGVLAASTVPVLAASTGVSVLAASTGVPVLAASTGVPVLAASTGVPVLAASTGVPVLAGSTGVSVLAASTGVPVLAGSTGVPVLAASTGVSVLAASTGVPVLAASTNGLVHQLRRRGVCAFVCPHRPPKRRRLTIWRMLAAAGQLRLHADNRFSSFS